MYWLPRPDHHDNCCISSLMNGAKNAYIAVSARMGKLATLMPVDT